MMSPPLIEVYSDASWGNDLETRRSTTGICVLFNGNVICWLSRRQATVARSSTEAEYMAVSDAAAEALWFKSMVKEVFEYDISVQIWCDNQSAIALSKNDTFHQRTKHIDIRYHFVRERIESGELLIGWKQTDQQLADIFTKPLGTTKFLHLRDKLMTPI